MTTPTPLERCFQYMRAFEVACLGGDWSVLDPHFCPDAIHTIAGGGPLSGRAVGRDAVIAGLRGGVDGLDRRFDLRIPEIIDGPVTREDGVWMRFRLTLRRAGVPDLCDRGRSPRDLSRRRDRAARRATRRRHRAPRRRLPRRVGRRPAAGRIGVRAAARWGATRITRRRRRSFDGALLRRGEERAGRRRRAHRVQRRVLDRHGRVRRRVARSQGDRAAPRALLPELPGLCGDAGRFRDEPGPRRELGSRADGLPRRLPRSACHRQERRSPGLLPDGDTRRPAHQRALLLRSRRALRTGREFPSRRFRPRCGRCARVRGRSR